MEETARNSRFTSDKTDTGGRGSCTSRLFKPFLRLSRSLAPSTGALDCPTTSWQTTMESYSGERYTRLFDSVTLVALWSLDGDNK